MKRVVTFFLILTVMGFFITPARKCHAKKRTKIGFVKVARGDVNLEREGINKKIKKNMKLLEGDKITTTETSLLTMYMKDGSIFTIPENSSLVLEKYSTNKSGTKRTASLNLLVGKLRGAAKSIKTKDPNIIIKTPSAVAGIRGTDVFVEVGKDKKNKNGAPITNISCLDGDCMAGSLDSINPKSSFSSTLLALIESTAHAAAKSVDLVQVPKGNFVSVTKNMSLENILKSAKKIPASVKRAITNNSPTSTKEHSDAITNNALAIDASSSKNTQSDIDSKVSTEDFIAQIDAAEKATDLKPDEIKKIIGTTRLTIVIELNTTN